MQAETHLLHSQPQTHLSGKHWRECLLCEDYTLNQEEMQRYYSLKEEANILFQQQERWDLIKSLYTEYFQTQPKQSGKEWMKLGFQGQYPETDFRGGGVLSLQLILRFVKHNRPLVREMEHDRANFFFAITAINIAFFMKKYFHFADFLVPVKDVSVYCNRRALKNICRLLVDNEESYMQIHQIFLKHFYQNIWLQAQKKNTQTLLQFNALFEQLTRCIRSTFENNTIVTMGDFRQAWLTAIG